MPSDQIDISKIKVGDRVRIDLKVTDVEPSASRVQIEFPSAFVWINSSDIISHTPKALEVGDRVRDPNGRIWEILGHRRTRSDGKSVYPAWNDASEFCGSLRAETVESWERLDAQ